MKRIITTMLLLTLSLSTAVSEEVNAKQLRIKVMTFNIIMASVPKWDKKMPWEERKDAVITEMTRSDFDIIQVQGNSQRQHDYIMDNIPRLERAGEARKAPWDGSIYYKKDLWEEISYDLPLIPKSSIQIVRLRHIETGKIYLAINCHLAYIARSAGRQRMVDELSRYLAGRSYKYDFVTFSGDFNASELEDTLSNAKAILSTRLESAWVIAHPTADHQQRIQTAGELFSARVSSNLDGTPILTDEQKKQLNAMSANKEHHIDYILVSPNLRVVSCEFSMERPNGIRPSDHEPLSADLIYSYQEP